MNQMSGPAAGALKSKREAGHAEHFQFSLSENTSMPCWLLKM
jgi:hypothetical protein